MPIQGNKTKINKTPKQENHSSSNNNKYLGLSYYRKRKKYAVRVLTSIIQTHSICLAFEGGN